MCIAGDHTVSMIDGQRISQEPLFTHKRYDAVGCRNNLGTLPRGDVKPLMEFPQPCKGRFPVPEFGRYPPLGGTDGRRGGKKISLIFEIFQRGY